MLYAEVLNEKFINTLKIQGIYFEHFFEALILKYFPLVKLSSSHTLHGLP